MPGGRPTTYNEKITSELCGRLSCGESLRTICKDEDMPVPSTVFLWMRKHPEFSKQYAQAKEESADALFEEILDIADNGTNDWMEIHDPDNPGYRLNKDSISRSRLRVDARKWAASKLKPKKYGDKIQQDHTSSDGTMTPSEIPASERLKELLDGIAERSGKAS